MSDALWNHIASPHATPKEHKTMQRTSPIRAVLTLFAFVTLALLTSAALNACNTTQGVGEDIEAAGDAIADTARDAKD